MFYSVSCICSRINAIRNIPTDSYALKHGLIENWCKNWSTFHTSEQAKKHTTYVDLLPDLSIDAYLLNIPVTGGRYQFNVKLNEEQKKCIRFYFIWHAFATITSIDANAKSYAISHTHIHFAVVVYVCVCLWLSSCLFCNYKIFILVFIYIFRWFVFDFLCRTYTLSTLMRMGEKREPSGPSIKKWKHFTYLHITIILFND